MRRVNYRHENISFKRLKNVVVLPKFQRSLVWKKDNKEKFINTILNGDPFGVLLLYKDDNSGEFTIIDGLQRYTTLLDFSKNPFDYITFNLDENIHILKVIEMIKQVYPDSGTDYIKKQIKDEFKVILKRYLDSNNNQDTFVPKELTKFIDKTYTLLPSDAPLLISTELTEFWLPILKNINIDDLDIPIITYQGDFSNLPDIFERLNTGGTKLSKYEVYSSSWSNIMLKLLTNRNNKGVLNHIEKKYKQLADDTGIEITDFEEGDIKTKGRVTLYEYVYGLGKEIVKESRTLTNNKPVSYSKDDSIGFSTLATFFGLHLKDLDKLVNHLNENISPLEYENITSIIIKCYIDVGLMLEPYIKENTKYIEAQVISIVYTWFILNYENKNGKITRKAVDTKLESLFKLNMPLRMLYDVLTNHWSGSGDNKLFEIAYGKIEDNRYLRPINPEAWKILLTGWVEDQSNKVSSTIPMDVRMFLSFITKKENDIRYTRHMIIPKNMTENVNLGHLGNVFLAQRYKQFNKKQLPLDVSQIEPQYLIPSEIIEYPKSKYSSDEYYRIVKERANKVIDRFIKIYYLEQ